MEEKKTKKVSVATILLILAIIGMGVMGFFIYKINDEKTQSEAEVEDLNNKITALENTMSSLQQEKSDKKSNTVSTNTTTKDNTNKITEISKIKDLIKNESKHERLEITNVKKDDGKYLVKANFYTPIVFSEKEYSEMVKTKKIVLNNKEYIYSDTDKIRNFNGYGYVYIEGQNIEGGYWIEKVNSGYVFVNEIGGCWSRIEKVKDTYEFYLDKDIKVDDFLSEDPICSLEEFMDKKDISNYKSVLVLNENELQISADCR